MFKEELEKILKNTISHTSHEKNCKHCKLLIQNSIENIYSLLADELPKEKCYFKRDLPTSRYKEAKFIEQGFNQCLKEVKTKLGIR